MQVRDIYDSGDYLVLVTTDRQSAFDRILASVPFKGQVFILATLLVLNIYSSNCDIISLLEFNFQVLNETSLWWFNRTQHITPNAVVSVPDKNVTIAKKCSVFPVEFVGEYLCYSYRSFCHMEGG